MTPENTQQKLSREKRETQVYGCTVERMNQGFDQALRFFENTAMLATSILSDTQELIALGHDEAARHYINRVKYLINNRAISNVRAMDESVVARVGAG